MSSSYGDWPKAQAILAKKRLTTKDEAEIFSYLCAFSLGEKVASALKECQSKTSVERILIKFLVTESLKCYFTTFSVIRSLLSLKKLKTTSIQAICETMIDLEKELARKSLYGSFKARFERTNHLILKNPKVSRHFGNYALSSLKNFFTKDNKEIWIYFDESQIKIRAKLIASSKNTVKQAFFDFMIEHRDKYLASECYHAFVQSMDVKDLVLRKIQNTLFQKSACLEPRYTKFAIITLEVISKTHEC